MSKKENPIDTEELKQQEINESVEQETTTENVEATEENEVDGEVEVTVNAEETAEPSADEELAKEEVSNKGGQKGKSGKQGAEKMAGELQELKDKYLRLYAEFDNYRKRTSKEKIDLIKTASQDVLVAILPVIDDFQRAIKMAKDDSNEEKMPEGVVLIYEKFIRTLEQRGLKMMETEGQDFDAELHEAITKIPAGEDLSGKIVDTVEPGYYLNDKIIRYAKVVVGQ